MSIFENIDGKLSSLANELGAQITRDRNGNTQGFEERRIDWFENGIKKAIIVQPTFTSDGVDSSLWNFINLAWTELNGIPQKPGWKCTLIVEDDFGNIDDKIDLLIHQSKLNLLSVTLEDVLNAKKSI